MRLSVFSSSRDAKIAAVIWWNGKLTLLLHRHSSNAFLAQLVERLIRNEQVVGSSPMKGSSEALKAIALNAFLFPLIYSSSMTDLYKTIESPAEGLYKAKGSKFLSFALPVRSADEVKERVKAYRKEYYDARHVCYAYVLGAERAEWRANDDGEPSSSAGKPILGQIDSLELSDVLVVVIRYFGGIKLGIPGLVRAYRSATADALSRAEIIEKTASRRYRLSFGYMDMNGVMKVLKDMKLPVSGQDLGMTCSLDTEVRLSLTSRFEEAIDKTGGCSFTIIQ